jgi:hypothetical protein
MKASETERWVLGEKRLLIFIQLGWGFRSSNKHSLQDSLRTTSAAEGVSFVSSKAMKA